MAPTRSLRAPPQRAARTDPATLSAVGAGRAIPGGGGGGACANHAARGGARGGGGGAAAPTSAA
jgi:hypothetical protein